MSELKRSLGGSLKTYLRDRANALAAKESALAAVKNVERIPVVVNYSGRYLDVTVCVPVNYKEESPEQLRSMLYGDVEKSLGRRAETGAYEDEFVSFRVKANRARVNRILQGIRNLSEKYLEAGVRLELEDLSLDLFGKRKELPARGRQRAYDKTAVVRDIAAGLGQKEILEKYAAQGLTDHGYRTLKVNLNAGAYKSLLRKKVKPVKREMSDEARERLIGKLKEYGRKPSESEWDALKDEFGIDGHRLWGFYLSYVLQGKGGRGP